MPERPRTYLDNAATSWPKPSTVYEAVENYQRCLGTAVGRSEYPQAKKVSQAVDEARAGVARLLAAESPERIIFTYSGTDSLNLAIHGSLRAGDHVVTSNVEHNSVLRPLRWLEHRLPLTITRVACDERSIIDPDSIRDAIRPNTKLIVVTHASNVTGAIQPLAKIGAIARHRGILFLVDAAQTLGHLPLSVADTGADLVASPGHKGLLGPLGTGILYIRPGVDDVIDSVRQGGTGSASLSDEQPHLLPAKYESGNPNAPGLMGLWAGIKFIEDTGVDTIRRRVAHLTDSLVERLRAIPGITLYGPCHSDTQVGVVSFSLRNHDSLSVAERLSADFGIQARAGYQCAALLHRALGTIDSNGTVRLSMGVFNTESDIATAADAVSRIAASTTGSVATVNCPCVNAAPDVVPSLQRSVSDSSLTATTIDAPSASLTRRACFPSDALPSSSACPCIDVTASARNPLKTSPATEVPSAELRHQRSISELVPGLSALWKHTDGNTAIAIAVLDGPVDLAHPSLSGAQLQSLSIPDTFPSSTGYATTHGTHVASIIFGQHHSGLKGIAPRCSGIIRPIFQDDSVAGSSQSALAAAIREAVDAGANVINISGGEPSFDSRADDDLRDAIQLCEDRRVLVVAAAGNGGCAKVHSCDCAHVPAALPSVLAVGAMDDLGAPLSFSNCSATYSTHGLLAPGKSILGSLPGNATATLTGTSFASPIVAGIAALLLSFQSKLGATPDPLAVRAALLQSADHCNPLADGDCRRLLSGRLNLTRAMSLISKGASMAVESNVIPADCGCKANAPPNPIPHDDDEATIRATTHAQDASASGKRRVPDAPTDRFNGLKPSSCVATGNGQLVYAIGNLMYDFGTTGNAESLQNSIPSSEVMGTANPLDINTPFGLLAYLLGYRIVLAEHGDVDQEGKSSKEKRKHHYEVCGNLHDAAFVTWILAHDKCPKYAIRPQGAYEEAGYLELIRFLIEQCDFRRFLHMPGCDNDKQQVYWLGGYGFQLRGDCLKSYYCCHGGTVCPCEAIKDEDFQNLCAKPGTKPVSFKPPDECKTEYDALAKRLGLSFTAAEFVAIAGHVCGDVKLFNGGVIPVISPSMRSTASWNLMSLIVAINKFRVAAGLPPLTPVERTFVIAMIATLAEKTKNNGVLPEERAFNYAATVAIQVFSSLLANDVFLQILTAADSSGTTVLSVGFDGFTVEPSDCRQVDTLPYDVTLIFYNVNVLRPSRLFVTFTVNVADVNPVARPARISLGR